ncbi:MAG: SMP-30/gluconolactonase/LRE family protein, partial [Mycobacterium sp.]|uniref:serine/threonine-protein kinase PknD n=1 Tax=Mycobacterium sp. TaxID=1785 RepID=UPI003BAF9D1D
PSNILLDDDDFAYLIDFGIARVADETRMTKSGNTIGTFAYIAPERLDGSGEEDARVDIYSLACMLYECLTGEPPFAADTMPRLIVAHLSTPPPRPSINQPNVPPQVDEVIATGMAKDPNERYATTIELADAAHDAITTPLAPPSEPTLLGDAAPTTPAPASAVQQQPADLNLAATQQRPPGRTPVPQRRPASQQPPEIGTPPRRQWWRRKVIVIPAALSAVAVIAAAIVISSQQHENSNSPQHREPAYGSQVTLPFTRNGYRGVAVDAAGNLYVTVGPTADNVNDGRVVKLAAGSSTPSVLPFTGLSYPNGAAVDAAGDLYVTDYTNQRVLKLAAGLATQTVLPFTFAMNTSFPEGVAVDTAGNLYVTDNGSNRVLELAAGSTTQTVLPFTGLNRAEAVAVDNAGNLYVTDVSRVLKLAAGSATQTVLPFTDIHPEGVAVDAAGDLYVVDRGNSRVLELAAGSATQSVLPFTGLNSPWGVAVDSAGNLYVADSGNGRLVKLPAG